MHKSLVATEEIAQLILKKNIQFTFFIPENCPALDYKLLICSFSQNMNVGCGIDVD